MSGRGFTADTVLIGYSTSDADTTLATLGVKGVNTGDAAAQLAAVVNTLNKEGGILGRKIKMVPTAISTADLLNDQNHAAESACAAWTEDAKVFAVVLPGVDNHLLRECLAKHDTPLIDDGPTTIGEPEFARYPNHLYEPGTLTTDKLDSLMIQSLVERRFFSPWDTLNGAPGTAPVKIGLVTVDTPDGRYHAQMLKQNLKLHGLSVTDEVFADGTASGNSSAAQSAVLRFATDGITHVIGSTLFFWESAEGQHYRPRYNLVAGGGNLSPQNAPSGQLNGAMTVGWIPPLDVDAAHDPGDPSPATTRCKKIMKAAGQAYSERLTLLSIEQTCEPLFLLTAALNASGDLSPAGLRAGVDSLGSTWQSPLTWTSHFAPGRHASAFAVRDQSYDAKCNCFFYVSNRNRA